MPRKEQRRERRRRGRRLLPAVVSVGNARGTPARSAIVGAFSFSSYFGVAVRVYVRVGVPECRRTYEVGPVGREGQPSEEGSHGELVCKEVVSLVVAVSASPSVLRGRRF